MSDFNEAIKEPKIMKIKEGCGVEMGENRCSTSVLEWSYVVVFDPLKLSPNLTFLGLCVPVLIF